MSPHDAAVVSLLPRRLLARVEQAWHQLGAEAMREAGVNAAAPAWVDDYALAAWTAKLGALDEEVAGRVEALLALMRPETDRDDRFIALQRVTAPMPPAMFQELVLDHVLAHLWRVRDPITACMTLEFGWDEDDARREAAERLGWCEWLLTVTQVGGGPG